jgi:hypothetical protein
VLHEDHTAAGLQAYFEQQCTLFLQWAQQEMAHRAERDLQLKAMRFPTAISARASASWRKPCTAPASAVCLLAQAPTGIGKPSAACSRC